VALTKTFFVPADTEITAFFVAGTRPINGVNTVSLSDGTVSNAQHAPESFFQHLANPGAYSLSGQAVTYNTSVIRNDYSGDKFITGIGFAGTGRRLFGSYDNCPP
jgi:hypothetical protein